MRGLDCLLLLARLECFDSCPDTEYYSISCCVLACTAFLPASYGQVCLNLMRAMLQMLANASDKILFDGRAMLHVRDAHDPASKVNARAWYCIRPFTAAVLPALDQRHFVLERPSAAKPCLLWPCDCRNPAQA